MNSHSAEFGQPLDPFVGSVGRLLKINKVSMFLLMRVQKPTFSYLAKMDRQNRQKVGGS